MTNAKIELDMFDVGLGSSILTQLYLEGEATPVRVLADAGIKVIEGNYPQDHVHQKLKAKLDTNFRLDLIIGTHYDQDHLAGLVPIIKDPDIEIGEVWLPPVNDFPERKKDKEFQVDVSQENTLPQLLLKGEVELSQQLNKMHKIAVCLNQKLKNIAIENKITLNEDKRENNEKNTQLNDFRYFELIAEIILKKTNHEDEFEWFVNYHFFYYWHFKYFLDDLTKHPKYVGDIVALAYVQKALCKSAITATYLAEVVQAIKDRNNAEPSNKIALKTYLLHQSGEPRFFSWDAQARAFKEANIKSQNNKEPRITLLGPSVELRDKYSNLLPVAQLYSIKYTTPSNRLSYVINIEYCQQKILICGDTGFYDFRPESSNNFYPKLVGELKNINILQVAHHAGNNEYFYEGLKEANFLNDADEKYLLIQHAYQDAKRPNAAFHNFIVQRDNQNKNKSKILFTCEPSLTKVHCYKHLIAPLTVPKAKNDDVSLEFDANKWKVTKHAIKI